MSSSSLSEEDDDGSLSKLREATSEELITHMKTTSSCHERKIPRNLQIQHIGFYNFKTHQNYPNFWLCKLNNMWIARLKSKNAGDISTDNVVPVKNWKPSKRSKASSDGANYDLISTPEFKAHVAKKLESLLDRSIEGINVKTKSKKITDLHGIRLLRSSSSEINGMIENNQIATKKKFNVSSSSDSDEERKLALVCVSGISVLNNGEGVFARNSIKDIALKSNNTDIVKIKANKRKCNVKRKVIKKKRFKTSS